MSTDRLNSHLTCFFSKFSINWYDDLVACPQGLSRWSACLLRPISWVQAPPSVTRKDFFLHRNWWAENAKPWVSYAHSMKTNEQLECWTLSATRNAGAYRGGQTLQLRPRLVQKSTAEGKTSYELTPLGPPPRFGDNVLDNCLSGLSPKRDCGSKMVMSGKKGKWLLKKVETNLFVDQRREPRNAVRVVTLWNTSVCAQIDAATLGSFGWAADKTFFVRSVALLCIRWHFFLGNPVR